MGQISFDNLRNLIDSDNDALISIIRNYVDQNPYNPEFLPLFKDILLKSQDSLLLEAVLYASLFRWGIKDSFIIKQAIHIIEHNTDEDLRGWAITGISKSYFNSRDIQSLKLFNRILYNKVEDEETRKSALRGILLLQGFNSDYIYSKTH